MESVYIWYYYAICGDFCINRTALGAAVHSRQKLSVIFFFVSLLMCRFHVGVRLDIKTGCGDEIVVSLMAFVWLTAGRGIFA